MLSCLSRPADSEAGYMQKVPTDNVQGGVRCGKLDQGVRKQCAHILLFLCVRRVGNGGRVSSVATKFNLHARRYGTDSDV